MGYYSAGDPLNREPAACLQSWRKQMPELLLAAACDVGSALFASSSAQLHQLILRPPRPGAAMKGASRGLSFARSAARSRRCAVQQTFQLPNSWHRKDSGPPPPSLPCCVAHSQEMGAPLVRLGERHGTSSKSSTIARMRCQCEPSQNTRRQTSHTLNRS